MNKYLKTGNVYFLLGNERHTGLINITQVEDFFFFEFEFREFYSSATDESPFVALSDLSRKLMKAYRIKLMVMGCHRHVFYRLSNDIERYLGLMYDEESNSTKQVKLLAELEDPSMFATFEEQEAYYLKMKNVIEVN
jgi:hypothetical protein